MNNVFKLATAFTLGAVAMYYLDPAVGRRRRAMVRDKGTAAVHDIERYGRAKSRRAADRMQGAVARTRAKLSRREVDDSRLHDRIRARLGRLIAHPGAVQVDVRHGHVVLRGSVPQADAESLTEALAAMQGVRGLDNELSIADAVGDVQTTA
ncbi:BON domain-containing protein [Luteimonas cucumeris]|uniref:BON domain-containing protein n=1 Tax=Luteimonas cucumeris TaxID=985012 RepID=A0A562L287_9GAMM|nr:BON domain-containing protein [Luteimonas cucumeris]TWI01741.1 BON domain-containing protein [Luteimonas cucumeris]